MTLLSAELPDPTGYGRVIRKGPKSNEVKAIVEEKAANPSQKRGRESNYGV
jgi:bifunctional UDP-N-acetylglucosamine pyrophosphorylase/glucosamine-1-phosphate N-acetyltransferase